MLHYCQSTQIEALVQKAQVVMELIEQKVALLRIIIACTTDDLHWDEGMNDFSVEWHGRKLRYESLRDEPSSLHVYDIVDEPTVPLVSICSAESSELHRLLRTLESLCYTQNHVQYATRAGKIATPEACDDDRAALELAEITSLLEKATQAASG